MINRGFAMPAGGLSLKNICGEKVCPEYNLCLDHDLQCYHCDSYCNSTSNNFDSHICEQQCQDYIHDYMRHYVRQSDIQSMSLDIARTNNALQELETMKSLMIFMTMLLIVAIVFIFITLGLLWTREKRSRNKVNICTKDRDSYFKKKLASLQYLKGKDKVNTISETVTEKAATNNNAMTSLAACTQTDLHMTATMSASSSSSSSSGQRTNTSSAGGGGDCNSSCSSNKLPCEDATVEFSGYDNFALKVSPVLQGKTIMTADLLQQYTP